MSKNSLMIVCILIILFALSGCSGDVIDGDTIDGDTTDSDSTDSDSTDGDLDIEAEMDSEEDFNLEIKEEPEAELDGDFDTELDGDSDAEPEVDSYTSPAPVFVPITVGSFWMGSPNDDDPCPAGYPPGDCTAEVEDPSGQKLHEVTLTYDFEIMTTEVTQGQWRAVAQAEGWGENPSYFFNCGADCPVESVNWFEALEYANVLSRNDGLSECYTLKDCTGTISAGCDGSPGCYTYMCTVALKGVTKPQDCEGYRLPTEAEWEYAIRAGNQYTAFYQSPGNNGLITQTDQSTLDPNLDQIGWYANNSEVSYDGGYNCRGLYTGSTTCGSQPVGGKEPNAWGLYDMSGNMDEWTWDRYQVEYQNDVGTDPTGSDISVNRVLRGGSWQYGLRQCRSAFRTFSLPGNRSYFIGFRLVRSINKKSQVIL